jgi:hypothetical protein
LDSSLSPAGSSPPTSPSSLTPRERENPWRSNKCNNSVPRSPTVYDWVVIGSWERWGAAAEQYSFSIWEGIVHCLYLYNDYYFLIGIQIQVVRTVCSRPDANIFL